MRLIDADQLLEDLMKYVTGGEAENATDCAEINRLIKEAPTVDNTAELKERMKKAVRAIKSYKVVDGFIYLQIFEVEQAIDKA
jgi:hypothetical protein